jgi:hypothetical protein
MGMSLVLGFSSLMPYCISPLRVVVLLLLPFHFTGNLFDCQALEQNFFFVLGQAFEYHFETIAEQAPLLKCKAL